MLPSICNPIYSFFKVRSEEEAQPSQALEFVSEESPKTWIKYKNCNNGKVFLGFQREEDDYETPDSWIKLGDEAEEKIFKPLEEKCIELDKSLPGNSKGTSFIYSSSPSEIGIILEERSQGKQLTPEERCQLNINRIALEKLLEMQSEYGIKKEDIRERLQQAEINLNKYYDIHQEKSR